MSKHYDIQICFIRMDGTRIDALRVIRITSVGETKEDVLRRLDRALSRWMVETPDGRQAWQESSEDFNVGDLVGYFTANGKPVPSLDSYLQAEGILKVKDLFTLTDASQESYDRVLASPS